MSSIILPSDHVTLTSCDDVNVALEPLKKLGVSFIDYVRVYNDRKRLHLTNSHGWVKFFFENHYTDNYLYFEKVENTNTSFWYSFINLWNTVSNKKIAASIMSKFGVSNGITIAKKYDDYNEYFYIGTDPDTHNIYDIYLNNLPKICQFTYYFKNKLNSLLKKATLEKIESPTTDNSKCRSIVELNVEDELCNTSDKQKFYLRDNIYLTNREYQCLKWLAYGKSSFEISIICGISQRTVEGHLRNMLQKFDCHKTTHLVYKATKLGIL
jgi:DNA-binding CsgD family transcriptional regulator